MGISATNTPVKVQLKQLNLIEWREKNALEIVCPVEFEEHVVHDGDGSHQTVLQCR